LYFIAIMLHALLEREPRRAMQHGHIGSLPLYPEERECSAPTADKILGLFDNLRRHRLFDGDQHIKTFWDELSERPNVRSSSCCRCRPAPTVSEAFWCSRKTRQNARSEVRKVG